MKKIVITGGSRGIGNGLARALLKRDCYVMITSRSQKTLNESINKIKQDIPDAKIYGTICDVRQFDQVKALWDEAENKFGAIDIWINNAGIGNPLGAFQELDPAISADVIQTNLVGSIFGASVALNGFIRQGYGALYNLEGLGSKDNRIVQGQSIYGTTKAAVYYLDKALAKEINQPGIIVGALQPGMILTDLVMDQYKDDPAEWEKVKGILTFLSEDVEVVCEWLADKILNNKKSGIRLAYSSTLKLLVRAVRRIFKKQ